MKNALIVALLFVAGSSFAGQLDAKFLKALNMVEASGRTGAIVGDNGKALGPYQIHKEYWRDVSASVGGKYSDVADRAYAEKVVTAYLNRYAPKAVAAHDYETLARVHNGGPVGAKASGTKVYWKKVKKFLDGK